MEDSGEKKKSVKTESLKKKSVKTESMKKEMVFDILCLAASYGILFLLPQKTGLFFYLVFGASAFLFCIGFFRLGLTFDAPSGSKGELSAGLSYTVIGALINAAGVYTIYQDHGSGRSIMIATLLLIEALVLFAMAGSGFTTPGYRVLSAIAFRVTAVLLTLLGALFMIREHFTESSVIISVFLLIESICLWKMGGGSNPFNTLNPGIQTVPGLKIPIGELQKTFAGVRTQLGYPWIGKVETLKQDSIIYGPSEDGFVVYGYYLFGRFYVSGSTNPFFPDPEDAQGHVAAEIPDSSGFLLNKEELAEAYVKMFTRYAENGDVRWLPDSPDRTAQ